MAYHGDIFQPDETDSAHSSDDDVIYLDDGRGNDIEIPRAWMDNAQVYEPTPFEQSLDRIVAERRAVLEAAEREREEAARLRREGNQQEPLQESSSAVAGQEFVTTHENTPEPAPKRVKNNHVAPSDETTSSSVEKPTENCDTKEDDPADDCLICMDVIMAEGEHRVCCLPCGHIFGHNCIVKWLTNADKAQRSCPQCKVKAYVKDVRVLFCRRMIRVGDNGELSSLRKDLSTTRLQMKEMEEANKFQGIRLQQFQDNCQRLTKEKTDLERILSEYRIQFGQLPPTSDLAPVQASSLPTSTKKSCANFMLCQIFDFPLPARVAALYQTGRMLIVSQYLEKRYGPFAGSSALKLISCGDFKTCELLQIPMAVNIRDICVNEATGQALAASQTSRTATVCSLRERSVIHQYTEEQPVWSCAWDTDDARMFYCGLSDGSVSVFDLRNLSSRLHIIPGSTRRPVYQLSHIKRNPQHAFPLGGLLVRTLDSMGFLQGAASANAHERLFTPLGPQDSPQFAGVLDPTTRLLATSFRPDRVHRNVRHSLMQLIYRPDTQPVVQTGELHVVNGGQNCAQMVRPALLRVPGADGEDEVLLATANQERSAVHLWDLVDQKPRQELKVGGLALDICPINLDGQKMFAAITEKSLRMYSLPVAQVDK